MEIKKLSPQGYCGGVKRALKIIIDAQNNPSIKKPIYMLGNIIHNKSVIKKLNELGIKSVDGKKNRLELLDEIESGTVESTDPLMIADKNKKENPEDIKENIEETEKSNEKEAEQNEKN